MTRTDQTARRTNERTNGGRNQEETIMTRTILTLVALGAVLSMNACTQVTGLDDRSSTQNGAPRGGDKNPADQIESPDEYVPGDGDGGGGGEDVKEPDAAEPRRDRRDPVEHTPVEGENSGGDNSDQSGATTQPTRQTGRGQHTP
jgi:hypothetical protein